jgi:hypothetical protein
MIDRGILNPIDVLTGTSDRLNSVSCNTLCINIFTCCGRFYAKYGVLVNMSKGKDKNVIYNI